jgi:hypothetical protein
VLWLSRSSFFYLCNLLYWRTSWLDEPAGYVSWNCPNLFCNRVQDYHYVSSFLSEGYFRSTHWKWLRDYIALHRALSFSFVSHHLNFIFHDSAHCIYLSQRTKNHVFERFRFRFLPVTAREVYQVYEFCCVTCAVYSVFKLFYLFRFIIIVDAHRSSNLLTIWATFSFSRTLLHGFNYTPRQRNSLLWQRPNCFLKLLFPVSIKLRSL